MDPVQIKQISCSKFSPHPCCFKAFIHKSSPLRLSLCVPALPGLGLDQKQKCQGNMIFIVLSVQLPSEQIRNVGGNPVLVSLL